MRTGLVSVAAVLLLAACGSAGGSGGGSSADPETLIGSSYAVTSITVDGSQREVLGPVAISFTADSISVATPCNGMSGPVTFSATNITVGDLAQTMMACEPALMDQDQLLAEVLATGPAWTVSDGKLTLTSGSTVVIADSAADGQSP